MGYIVTRPKTEGRIEVFNLDVKCRSRVKERKRVMLLLQRELSGLVDLLPIKAILCIWAGVNFIEFNGFDDEEWADFIYNEDGWIQTELTNGTKLNETEDSYLSWKLFAAMSL